VLFGTISYLLEHYPLPPELRAALYQVLTRLDGVRLIGGVTDLAGRRAVSVAVDLDQPLHERDELFLDPATGRLLGARSDRPILSHSLTGRLGSRPEAVLVPCQQLGGDVDHLAS
jgi:hypothetical protein